MIWESRITFMFAVANSVAVLCMCGLLYFVTKHVKKRSASVHFRLAETQKQQQKRRSCKN